MKVLVTGNAGFIGSNLTEFLLNKNYVVVGIDCFTPYYSRKVKEHNVSGFTASNNYYFYELDFSVPENVDRVFSDHSDIEAIVHLGAWGGVTYSLENPIIYSKDNFYATSILAKKATDKRIKSFIFASSSSVYGNTTPPFKESANTDKVFSPYGASKKSCEVFLYPFSLNFDLNVAILRFFNPLGPRLRPDLALPKMIRSAIYGTEFPLYQDLSSNARDYTYILHMLDAIEHLINKPVKYDIFNLGNSNPVNLQTVSEAVKEVTRREVNFVKKPARPAEMDITYADITHAKDVLGYNPTTTIAEMVKIYYDWYIQQPEWYQKGEF